MDLGLPLTGYFAGALFSGQELYGNRVLAEQIHIVSNGLVRMDLPQDFPIQDGGDGRATRSADFLGMLERDFVFANFNGAELDSGTVAEFMVAAMLGVPRVQFRSDFRNASELPTRFAGPATIRKTTAVPYNLMLGHDESAMVFVDSMRLHQASASDADFTRKLAVYAVRGIQLAFEHTETAEPNEYATFHLPLTRNLRLDAALVADILLKKQQRHAGDGYRHARLQLSALTLS